jgi:hypothetical protein
MPPYDAARLPSFASAAEQIAYADALAAERHRHVEVLHALHQQLTGDPGPDDLRALDDALRIHPDVSPGEVHSGLALARAGHASEAPEGTYADYLRETLSAGDRLEARLATAVGADRARALIDGAGTRHTLTGCDEDGALYRSER